jgi:hypothetical protein
MLIAGPRKSDICIKTTSVKRSCSVFERNLFKKIEELFRLELWLWLGLKLGLGIEELFIKERQSLSIML